MLRHNVMYWLYIRMYIYVQIYLILYSPCEISDFLDSPSNPNRSQPYSREDHWPRKFVWPTIQDSEVCQSYETSTSQFGILSTMRGSCVHFSKYFTILFLCPWGQGPDIFPWRRLQFFLFGRELKKLHYIATSLLSLSIFWVDIKSENRENISEHCGMSLYLEMRSDSKEKFVDQFNLALLN